VSPAADGTSENAVAATAATMGVRVNGLGQYRFVAAYAEAEPDPRPPDLVLGFGNARDRWHPQEPDRGPPRDSSSVQLSM